MGKRICIYAIAFILGFVTMGFEMVASRLMAPFFGSGIDTWAALISTMLVALATGYFIGGSLPARFKTPGMMSGVILLAAFQLALLPLINADMPRLLIRMLGDGPATLLATSILLCFVPITLLGIFSPCSVDLIAGLAPTQKAGAIAGRLYGISTLGNVAGTLGTAFYLIPHLGSGNLIFLMSVLTFTSGLLLWIMARREYTAVLPVLFLIVAAGTFDSTAHAETVMVNDHAAYPEGPLWLDGKLYYTEMYRDRVDVSDGKVSRVFWSERGCGPVSVAPYENGDTLVILCHLTHKVALVRKVDSTTLKEFSYAEDGSKFHHPNDSSADGKGGVYFSSSGDYTLDAPPTGTVYYLSAEGLITPVSGISHIDYANGVLADEGELFVSETFSRRVLVYSILAPGKVGRLLKAIGLDALTPAPQTNYPLAGPDDLRTDAAHNIYIPDYGASRIVVTTHDGALIKVIPTPVKFVTTGGPSPDGKKLVIVGTNDNANPNFPGKVFVMDNPVLP